jgi:hypothetical protein
MLPHLLIVCRAFLWITFAYSFWGKVQDLPAFTVAIGRFQLLPPVLAKPAALIFLGVELCLILSLGIGVWLAASFALAFSLLSIFTIALIIVLLRQQPIACHCFGADEQPIGWADVIRNGGLLLVTVLGWVAPLTVGMGESLFWLFALMGMVYGLLWLHLSDMVHLLQTIRQASQPGAVS